MIYRHLGRTGLEVSLLSLGAWVTYGGQVGEDVAYACMTAAREGGVNLFDNAEVYAGGEAERVMGAVFRRAGWAREDLVVTTKVFWGGEGPNRRGLSRKHIVEGVDASLERLGLRYVDLVFCHRPDIDTPIEETVEAMGDLVRSGRALYWGTSEWSAAEITRAWHLARARDLPVPVVEQPQYNMFHRERVEREYAPLYRWFGLGTTTWSPLASGFLSGKYLDGVPEGSRLALAEYAWLRERFEGEANRSKHEAVRALRPIAERIGATLAQLAIAWCASNPRVSSVITGATSPAQVRENLASLACLDAIDGVRSEIEEILGNRPEPERSWR